MKLKEVNLEGVVVDEVAKAEAVRYLFKHNSLFPINGAKLFKCQSYYPTCHFLLILLM